MTIYISGREAARRLGVSNSTIGNWIRDGRLGGRKMSGKNASFMIPVSEVERVQQLEQDRLRRQKENIT
jgi:excisionase family DNA binding protein